MAEGKNGIGPDGWARGPEREGEPGNGGGRMKKKDPVRGFLEERGCPRHVVEGGVPGLVRRWEQVVEETAKGYALTLDDYLNDLDGRQILEDILEALPNSANDKIRERIRRADRKMRGLVDPAGKCLWGSEVAETEGWTAEKNWWYFCRPRKADSDFLAEIDNI